MVIPWVGFPLSNLIKKCEPTSKANFVTMTTLFDPARMPGQRVPVLAWPYLEGLRMDEAMQRLTILAVGLYGEPINTWKFAASNEYGFYANVNPAVDHPRWSQATERRLPSLFKNRKTLPFNGYGDQVAAMYAGLDPKQLY